LLALFEGLHLAADDAGNEVAQGEGAAVAEVGREGDGPVGKERLHAPQRLSADVNHDAPLRRNREREWSISDRRRVDCNPAPGTQPASLSQEGKVEVRTCFAGQNALR